jgi:hypothetical protein
MKRIIKIIIFILLVIILTLFCYFFVGWTTQAKKITWGVDFSQMQAEALNLNWKEVYLAVLNDLGAKNIKLHTQWDFVEGKKDSFFFDDIDWQLKKAKENNAKVIYVLGMKTGRWPECHIPSWAQNLSEQQQQNEVLAYIKEVVLRYKDNNVITNWQVENEPLFDFGQCPSWYYNSDDFLKKEVKLVKSLDPWRSIIISDSGELSSWMNASKIGDIVGTTMYRKAWVNINSFGMLGIVPGFYGTYPIPPVFYERKSALVNFLFNKKVICVELQAEPWASRTFYDVPLPEQEKTMNINQFRSNVEYAKKTGLDTFYFWGDEWWYWMKTTQNRPEIWNEAQNIFKSN